MCRNVALADNCENIIEPHNSLIDLLVGDRVLIMFCLGVLSFLSCV